MRGEPSENTGSTPVRFVMSMPSAWKEKQKLGVIAKFNCPDCRGSGFEKETVQNGELLQKGTCSTCQGGDAVPCTLCREWRGDFDSLDLHHWDYETDQGVVLCRTCHEAVHDGQSVSEQQSEAEEAGKTWQELAVGNLIRLDLRESPNSFEESQYDDYQNYLQERYNIPRWVLERER